MKKYSTSSRKLVKLDRKASELASAPTSPRTAVMLMVMERTLSVGRTFLRESIPLMRVSDPPYMFSAVTEIRPSAEKTRMTPPKPLKSRLPASWMDPMVVNAAPAPAARRVPRPISQKAPSADPPYVQYNVLLTVTFVFKYRE